MVNPQKITNNQISDITNLIAQVLQIPEYMVTDQLSYRSIMQWDSLAHINLMLALETTYGVTIEPDTIVTLSSVAQIKAYMQGTLQPTSTHTAGIETQTDGGVVYRGLAGVTFDQSQITLIDGKQGRLQYRGYSIHDLVEQTTFEETAFLLLNGQLPTTTELDQFKHQLVAAREIPATILELIQLLKDGHPTEVLRTCLSALATFDAERLDGSVTATKARSIRLIAQMPCLIAAHHAIRQGKTPIQPNPTLDHAANFLYMLQGTIPSQQAQQIVNQILILHADHSANASTFAARVVAGTRSDWYAALTAAIAAFAGPLHGGAIEQVIAMIQAIGTPERAADYVANLQANNQPVMGFGHRVYQTEDPRARHLRKAAQALSAQSDNNYYAILEAVVQAMRPYMAKGIDVNVDFYASVIYHLLGIPYDLFVPAFIVGRTVGWLAQIQEQYANNILIRPLLAYVGPIDQPYPALSQRQ
ncbi:MAG TPA: citrate (Si)-synthase [Herpetosiphon sp.]|uniref:citrate synthase (unknown stereospecificity) n=1 Tax=Herpetosiphon aurantiacus (strain ATCC 23779 / DSM 785 / 114-95) TaxID=316274 RepID=A9AVI3_HERA2|nr:citrate/2-methylcitrate synthase [Herpetosiphon sp.]ABX04674.1 Citrate (Si)-synthase [Herpetosiphon aurantiacus DSM 785]HBW48610.1 citrate (Si)-synthase [Herpetosiphon sp.]